MLHKITLLAASLSRSVPVASALLMAFSLASVDAVAQPGRIGPIPGGNHGTNPNHQPGQIGPIPGGEHGTNPNPQLHQPGEIGPVPGGEHGTNHNPPLIHSGSGGGLGSTLGGHWG